MSVRSSLAFASMILKRLAWVVPAAMLSVGAVAHAADTQWWISDAPADHAKAEARGIIVRADGSIELGPRSEVSLGDSLTTVWSIVVLRDGSVAVAGDHGRIDRWTEKGGLKPWVKLPVGQVFSLAASADGVVAGTGPEGIVYSVGARGDTARICVTGERYVWALAPSGPGAWYAATGTHGRLLRIKGGQAERVFDSDESNLVSMVPDGSGGVYVGGDSKGRVIHVSAQGTPHTVYDAGEDEIRSLAVGPDGALYAAALSGAVVSTGSDDNAPAAVSLAPSRGAVGDARASIYRIVPDSIVTLAWNSTQPFVHALLPTRGGLLAATGNRAGIYRLEGNESAALLLAAPQGQVTALAASGDLVFAATSNPAALWRLGPGLAERGELLSPTLDARRIAHFGRVLWRGDPQGARVELFTHSGNSDPADSTWTPWEGGTASAEGRAAASPPARYFQWKLTLSGGHPRLTSIEASWREQNLPPRVEDVTVAGQAQGVREGNLVPRSEPITQSLPGGQKVEYSLTQQPTPRTLRELPVWAQGLRTAQWRGIDPNGDRLTYRLEVSLEDQAAAILLADDLDTPTWTFDTHTLPDGRYRLRVTASDRAGNAQGEARTGDGISAPFGVDNTPPSVTRLELAASREGIRVSGEAADALSALSRLEVAYDGEDWIPVTPHGGFTDSRHLEFSTLLSKPKPGAHSVGIRAVDEAGNSVTRAAHIELPAR